MSVLDSTGTELFANYDSDFQLAYGEIAQTLEEIPNLGVDQQKASIKATERAVEEAYEIIDQMAIEVQNIPSSSRSKFNTKLREYRANVENARKQLRKIAENSDRRALFGDRLNTSSPDNIPLDQRQQLLTGQASLDRSTQRLRDSQRVANETESIGANILNDLRGQREQITNARNTLLEADGYVDKSIRTLRGMARR